MSYFQNLRRSTAWAILCLVLCLLGLGVSATAQEFFFITTFDAPHAGKSAGQGTTAKGIIPGGAIVGYYVDANYAYHGFLRAPHGRITTIDDPDAVTGALQGTWPHGMNPAGAITGQYYGTDGFWHGFLRDPQGNFTSFDGPRIGVKHGCPPLWTEGASINSAGWIAGDYIDACWYADHGLLRAPDGTLTEFDAPDSVFPGCATAEYACDYWGTYSAFFSGINPTGTITGAFVDWYWGSPHSWVGTPASITEFDAPNTTLDEYGSWGNSINPAGAVTGTFLDQYSVYHGYLRAPGGAITTFDVPHSYGTEANGINPSGVIVGQYLDSRGVNHGFLRSPQGRFTTFDAPGSGHSASQGTYPYSNNAEGAITGTYLDRHNVYHGFVAIPLW
jgi:hypothetical protein